MKNNIPILTFVQRYWMLLIAAALAVAACLNDALFKAIGTLLYVPAALAVAVVSYLFIIHLWFRETIDRDTHDGTYLRMWQALPDERRVTLTVWYRIGLWIGVAIIVAGVVK